MCTCKKTENSFLLFLNVDFLWAGKCFFSAALQCWQPFNELLKISKSIILLPCGMQFSFFASFRWRTISDQGESWRSTCLETFRWIAWCRVYQKQDLNHNWLKRVSLFFGGDQSSTSSSKSNFLFALHSFIPRVLSVLPLRLGFSRENRPFSSRNGVCSPASVALFQTFQLFSVFHCTKNSKRSLRPEKVHRDHSATSFAYDHDPLPSLLSGR